MIHLRSRLLLLLLPESKERDTGDLDNLESDTGDISLSLTLSTETGEQDLVVLVDEVEATIVRHESGDSLTVLGQLDSDTLSDTGVGLLGLNTDLLEHNALGVRGTSEGRGLEGSAQKSLLVRGISPSAMVSMAAKGSLKARRSQCDGTWQIGQTNTALEHRQLKDTFSVVVGEKHIHKHIIHDTEEKGACR